MLATESGKTANQVSETIVTELINKQIIENISDNWGFPVADCYERDVTVVEMVDVIRAIGIYPVRSVHLDALLECVLMATMIARSVAGKWRLQTASIDVPEATDI